MKPSAPKCPACAEVIDGVVAVGVPQRGPQPGDVTICKTCATPLKFNDDMQLTSMTYAEIGRLPHDIAYLLGRAKGFIEKRRKH